MEIVSANQKHSVSRTQSRRGPSRSLIAVFLPQLWHPLASFSKFLAHGNHYLLRAPHPLAILGLDGSAETRARELTEQ